jgi:hypothetical protein
MSVSGITYRPVPGTHCTGGLEGPTQRLEEKSFASTRYRTQIIQLVVRHYTDTLSLSLSLSYCFQSLILVCSSSHELLILGISVRIFLMQWFLLAFCMIVCRHTVGLLWKSDQPVSETSTCTGQHNIETQEINIHALSRIRNRDPSIQAAADLRLRPRGHWDRLY